LFNSTTPFYQVDQNSSAIYFLLYLAYFVGDRFVEGVDNRRTAILRDVVCIFTAVEEQLGLKLMPSKGPVDTLVIDHIEMPSPN